MERKEQEAEGGISKLRLQGQSVDVTESRMRRSDEEEDDLTYWTNGAYEAICSLHGVVSAYAEVVPSFCRVAVAPVNYINQGAKQKNSWS